MKKEDDSRAALEAFLTSVLRVPVIRAYTKHELHLMASDWAQPILNKIRLAAGYDVDAMIKSALEKPRCKKPRCKE